MIGKGHSEVLPIMVAAGLSSTHLKVADLDRIGVVIGPGAFAGLRVGLAFARGLCLGTKARAFGVTSLQALAAGVEPHDVIAPIFDARRGQVYAALFDGAMTEVLAPFVATPEVAARKLCTHAGIILAGSGAMLVSPYVTAPHAISNVRRIDPAAIARLARAAPTPTVPPAPLYLRAPDATPLSPSLFRESGAP